MQSRTHGSFSASTILLVVMMLCGSISMAVPDVPMANIQFVVVDEEGKSVSDARLELKLNTITEDGYGHFHDNGLTDARGVWLWRGKTFGSGYISVSKDGYYSSSHKVGLSKYVPDGVEITRKWPDVTETILLRPILNPVPMYARGTRFNFPSEDAEMGFDFVVGDWVEPHGSGETTDFLLIRKNISDEEVEIVIKFPNAGDGFFRIEPELWHRESEFRIPRYAPETDYSGEWRIVINPNRYLPARDAAEGSGLWEVPLFFRIRTALDDEHQVQSALYGRVGWLGGVQVYGAFSFSTKSRKAPHGDVAFSFRLNPDGTRNMETDTSKNLAEGSINSSSKVRTP